MKTDLLEMVVTGRAPPVVGLKVDQYHRMIAAGILREGAPIELIDGVLMRKDRGSIADRLRLNGTARETIDFGDDRLSPDSLPATEDGALHGTPHAAAVGCVADLSARTVSFGCHIRSQLPLSVPPADSPEPDGAVVRGRRADYLGRHPSPSDVVAVIEVADSSLDYDRTTKQRIYAGAEIGQYWIVNIPERQIEVYESPLPAEGRYARRRDFRSGEAVPMSFDGGAAIEVAVDEILVPPVQ